MSAPAIQIQHTLSNAGASATALIYFPMLADAAQSVPELSDQLLLGKTSIYKVLERFEELGLVRSSSRPVTKKRGSTPQEWKLARKGQNLYRALLKQMHMLAGPSSYDGEGLPTIDGGSPADKISPTAPKGFSFLRLWKFMADSPMNLEISAYAEHLSQSPMATPVLARLLGLSLRKASYSLNYYLRSGLIDSYPLPLALFHRDELLHNRFFHRVT